jgi:hypothetical protein
MTDEELETRKLVLLHDVVLMLGCDPDAPISTVLNGRMSAEDRRRVEELVAARQAEWAAEELREAEAAGVPLPQH